MKKKFVSLMFACVLGISLMGCGKTPTDSKASGDKDSKEEPYTVTFVMRGTAQADEERIEEKVNAILEKELNAKMDLVVLPWGSAEQQLKLMLSGDEKIDFFYSSPTDAMQYINAGQIVDMTELAEKYGTNLKEIFGMDILKTNTVDGFLYGVPAQIERGAIPAVYMRKDLVEKYNIDVSAIKEPKDMEKVYEIVKAGEPDMTMLYSEAGDTDTPLNRLNSVDGLGDVSSGVLMNPLEDTTVENYYESDWYMETATMLHDWYERGYINKDAATNTEGWRTMLKAGNVFSAFYIYHPATPIEFSSTTGYEYEMVKFEDYAIKKSDAYSGIIFAIAQNSENPDKAMQVLDYIYGSPEVMNLLNWGEEGTDYQIIDQENDIIDYPEGMSADTVGYSLNLGWELPNQFIAHSWNGSEPGIWKQVEAFNDEAKDSKALGFIFDNKGLETQIANVSNVVKQYDGPISSGSVDPKEYIPQFLDALEAAGINDLISAKQEQLNEWLSGK